METPKFKVGQHVIVDTYLGQLGGKGVITSIITHNSVRQYGPIVSFHSYLVSMSIYELPVEVRPNAIELDKEYYFNKMIESANNYRSTL
jgi:hypothetical protein